MGGMSTGRSLASELKEKADRKHNDEKDKEAIRIYNLVVTQAKKSANDGAYYVDIYDDALGNSEVDKELKRRLVEQGFKVRISEDTQYSAHAGKTMMFVRASWE